MRRFFFKHPKMLLMEIDPSSTDSIPQGKTHIYREATKKDIEELIQLYPPDFGISTKRTVKKCIRKRFADEVPCYVCEQNNNIVGFVWFPDWPEDYPMFAAPLAKEVCNLFTVPSCRGQGIARELILFGLRCCYNKGVKAVYSRIYLSRMSSIAAHLRIGFRPISIIQGDNRVWTGKYRTIISNNYPNSHGILEQAPLAIIFGDDSPNTLAIARGLGRIGVYVIQIAQTCNDLTRHSRFINESYIIHKRDNTTIFKFFEIITRRFKSTPIIYITNEKHLPILVQLKKKFNGKLRFIGNPESLLPWISKEKQAELASQVGFSIPASFTIQKQCDIKKLTSMRYPIICKPESSHSLGFDEKVRIFSSFEEAESFLANCFTDETNILAQEYIEGNDTNVLFYLVLCGKNGHIISDLTGKKLLQTPPQSGLMTIGVLEENAEFQNLARLFFQNLNIPGIFGLEAKIKETNQGLYFIEANLRSEGISSITDSIEIPLIAMSFFLATNRESTIPKHTINKIGLWVWEWESLVLGIRKYLFRIDKWIINIFRIMSMRRSYAIWAADDPMPFIVGIRNYIKKKISVAGT